MSKSIHSNNQSNAFLLTQTNFTAEQQGNSSILKKSRKGSFNLFKSQNQSKQKSVSPELESIINKIQAFVDDVDNKIQNRVQLVKQVYLNEYKEQVVQMSGQLKNLREKLDNEVMKERANEKMFYLQEQRDFFRSQVLKLNQEMNKLNVQNKSLKKLIEEEKRQSQNYKKIVYNLESKLLKLKNVNVKRQKMLEVQTDTLRSQKVKNPASTMDTKFVSGAKTQRNTHRNLNNAQIAQNQQVQQMRGTYKLGSSQSMKSYSHKLLGSHKEVMRSTAMVSYPKLMTERLQKIQGYSQLLQRQNVIDQCLNELKKQIYYRNLSIGEKQTKIHFNEGSKIKFQSFTKTDKKELIIKLLSNQKILNEFYQFLFNNRAPSPLNTTNQLINNKLDTSGRGLQNKFSVSKLKSADNKFNTQMLSNLKTQFNKKIFDIKNNR